ncbi:MAG: circularly permuted type 2 ATP-grasp protein [Candidatus Acidiferrales bacterium]
MNGPATASQSPQAQPAPTPAEVWHGLLRPDVELAPAFSNELNARMRAQRLVFGDRIHCPFLRPFFLTAEDEQRVRAVAESIAVLGERVVKQSLADPRLLAQSALSPEEERLARINPRYATSSTASRLDAFLLPNSLQFAEYNAESPAGPGYAETLADVFLTLPVMERFSQRYTVRKYPLMKQLLAALLASYREWGGSASPPVIAIVDWREVPTWSEFEIIQSHFQKDGVATVLADPRDLVWKSGKLTANGQRVDLVYRRVLINDIVARPQECAALVEAYKSGTVCVANALTCKIPHKKSFFAVLTDEQNSALFNQSERELIRRHIPWTRLLADTKTTRNGESFGLLEYVRKNRENFVLKPNDEYGGTGVQLGWENNEAQWDAALQRALTDRTSAWVVQERIAIRREIFPMQTETGIQMRDMLVDFAPYLFRGKMAGCLTRLSSTGLANVTSGGGQVPSFVVEPRP